MDLGGQAEEWYIYVGMAMFGLALVGIVLNLPTAAGPDANVAANTIDRVAGSQYNASAEYDHDAEFYWVGVEQLAMRNENGKSTQSISFGQMTPAKQYPKLEAVLHGASPAAEFSDPSDFQARAETARDNVDLNDPEWIKAGEKLHVRTVIWGGTKVVLVAM